MTVDIGQEAVYGANNAGARTTIQQTKTAGSAGSITSIDVYTGGALSSLYIGSFYYVSGSSPNAIWYCRDAQSAGSIPGSGLNQVSGLETSVEIGDSIGEWWAGSSIRASYQGGGLSKLCTPDNNNHCVADTSTTYTNNDYPLKLGGYIEIILVVSTQAADDITYTTATLHGTIVALESTASVRGFKYGKTSGALDLDVHEDGSFGTGAFELGVTDLDIDDTYYFQAYATDGSGTKYGAELSFDTEAPHIPTVANAAASNLGVYSATLNGIITDGGYYAVTKRGFRYGKTQGSLDKDVNETGSFSEGAFALNVSDLT